MIELSREHDLDFLMERYHNLQRYREKSLTAAPGPENSATDRRHENHLRGLVDEGSYDAAVTYLEDMARLCEAIEDFAAVELYRGYQERIKDLRAAAV
ncbi:MAG: hypothetical protein HRF49_00105 [bacterium]